jgi:hypothetical protein
LTSAFVDKIRAHPDVVVSTVPVTLGLFARDLMVPDLDGGAGR